MKELACDFCGCKDRLRTYPTDDRGVAWTACTVCVALIGNQDWSRFIERAVAAFADLQVIPEDDKNLFRNELALALMTPHEEELDPAAAELNDSVNC